MPHSLWESQFPEQGPKVGQGNENTDSQPPDHQRIPNKTVLWNVESKMKQAILSTSILHSLHSFKYGYLTKIKLNSDLSYLQLYISWYVHISPR